MRPLIWTLFLLSGTFSGPLHAQNDRMPVELERRFKLYATAWQTRDWDTVFDLTAPAYQKLFIQEFGSREGYGQNQEKTLKSKIASMEATGIHRLSDNLYTLETLTQIKQPDGSNGTSRALISFRKIDGQWFVVMPAPPDAVKNGDNRKTESDRGAKENRDNHSSPGKVAIEPGFN